MCYGQERTAKTPTIDSLRKIGTFFLNAISATTTTPTSVASILTGLYPPTHAIRSFRYKLNPDCITLAEVFRSNGYNTYAEVTATLGPKYGLNKGFNHYHYREVINDVYSPWGKSLIKRFERKEFKEPWFIFIHFFELHFPRKIHKQFDTKEYGRSRYERALSSLDAYIGELLEYVDRDTVIVLHADHGERLFETKFRSFKRKFLLFSMKLPGHKLKQKLGLGPERIRPLIGRHGSHVLDIMVKVPLIFFGRELFPENNSIRQQVRQIDVFPTIVNSLKLEYEDNIIDGRSLLPLMKGEEMSEVPTFCEAVGIPLGSKKNWLMGIRTLKYKYVFSPYNDKFPEELYDLEQDPMEKKNILNKKRDIAKELRRKIEEEYLKLGKSEKEFKFSTSEEDILKARLRTLGYL
jgi:arylsulfatase A-like enzyme